MLVEGRIETTNFQENFDLQVTFGLDTAEEHRLLDQRIARETNCRVARMRTTLLLAIGLVFLGLGLIGTLYRSILQRPGERLSTVYIPGVALQPTNTAVLIGDQPTDTPPPGEPTSTPAPTHTPLPDTPTPTVSPTKQAFSKLTFCVESPSARTINVRSGPGTNYAPLGDPLPVGTCLIFGTRSEDDMWLQVAPDQSDRILEQYAGGWILRTLLGLGTTDPIDLPAVTLTPTLVPTRVAAWVPGLFLDMHVGKAPMQFTGISSKKGRSDRAASSSFYSVEAEWPASIEVKQPGRIRVSLIRTSEGYVPQVEIPGSTAVVFTPVPVGTPDRDLESAFGDEYRPYAAVARIIGVSFDFDPAPISEPQLLDQPRVDWIWSISSSNPGKHQGVDITIEIEWRREGDIQESLKRTIWRDHIEIDIFQRRILLGQVNAFSLLSGLLGSGLSIPWLYEMISKRRTRQRRKGKKRI